MNTKDNGWPEYRKLVEFRFDAMEKRVNSLDRKLWALLVAVVVDVVVRVSMGVGS